MEFSWLCFRNRHNFLRVSHVRLTTPAFSGLQDPDLCTEILFAHGWYLKQAISFFFLISNPFDEPTTIDDSPFSFIPATISFNSNTEEAIVVLTTIAAGTNAALGLAWEVMTLRFSIISGSLVVLDSRCGLLGLILWK
ncbi:plant UBX domain-containing protein 10-like [Coffea eugenioides]|uniref:plant UBX domain-containing protein 10-like n=1 Tax=Coffea eugenioides TaxID=49369 RepID=UPI000F61448A|nr:plant UBX domain-containing protein 10-like [Coffea eugenioides]